MSDQDLTPEEEQVQPMPIAMNGKPVDVAMSFGGVKALLRPPGMLKAAKAIEKTQDYDAAYKGLGDWFKDEADKKMKFEIDDTQAKFRAGMFSSVTHPKTKSEYLNTGKGKTAGDLLEHPKLFSNYPGFEKIPTEVRIRPDIEKSKAEIKVYTDKGHPRYEISIEAIDMLEARSLLLHELQHAAQEHEGFAKGASHKGKTYEAYMNTKGEIESRLVERRAHNPTYNAAISPNMDRQLMLQEESEDHGWPNPADKFTPKTPASR